MTGQSSHEITKAVHIVTVDVPEFDGTVIGPTGKHANRVESQRVNVTAMASETSQQIAAGFVPEHDRVVAGTAGEQEDGRECDCNNAAVIISS